MHVGQELANVITIVINPLLKQIGDAEISDHLVSAPALQIGCVEVAYEADAIPPQREKFGQNPGRRLLTIGPLSGNRTRLGFNPSRTGSGGRRRPVRSCRRPIVPGCHTRTPAKTRHCALLFHCTACPDG